MKLFIDDERSPPDDDSEWIILRSLTEVMEYLDSRIIHDHSDWFPEYISFDHDLGQNQPTGYDIAKKMVEMDMDGLMLFPDNFSWTVHSMNPVGAGNIDGLLQSYMTFRKEYYDA